MCRSLLVVSHLTDSTQWPGTTGLLIDSHFSFYQIYWQLCGDGVLLLCQSFLVVVLKTEVIPHKGTMTRGRKYFLSHINFSHTQERAITRTVCWRNIRYSGFVGTETRRYCSSGSPADITLDSLLWICWHRDYQILFICCSSADTTVWYWPKGESCTVVFVLLFSIQLI